MAARKLIVFKHEHPMGNAPAHVLFEKVKVLRVDKDGKALNTNEESVAPARSYADYRVEMDRDLPEGVSIEELF